MHIVELLDVRHNVSIHLNIQKLSNKINHSAKKKKITNKSLTKPGLLKVYVSLLSQEHFQYYCKSYNCHSHMLIQ